MHVRTIRCIESSWYETIQNTWLPRHCFPLIMMKDLIFPAIASGYILLISRLAFPAVRSRSNGGREIFKGGKLFRSYVVTDPRMLKTGFDLQTYNSNHLLQSLINNGDLFEVARRNASQEHLHRKPDDLRMHQVRRA